MSALFSRLPRYLLVFTLLVVAIYLCLRAVVYVLEQPTRLPGEYFSYGDSQVRYVCKGSGEPLILFETGFGSDSETTWSGIVKTLPDSFTSCYYDRLGYGGSSDVPANYSTEDKSLLQQSLLEHIAGNRPVILVASSYGGIISRRTVARSELNIQELILLDSAHENQHGILRGKLTPIPDSAVFYTYLDAIFGYSAIRRLLQPQEADGDNRLAVFYSSLKYASALDAYTSEGGFFTPLDSLNYDFGDLKVSVLAHDNDVYAEHPRFKHVGDQWTQLQQELAALSSNSELTVVKGASHNIPGDAPEKVTEVIISAVNGLKNPQVL